MIGIAERNARDYGLSARAEYRHSDGSKMPFEDSKFDAVFSTGSLHEWGDPCGTLDEMWRILKPGGRIFISDLRRDMPRAHKVVLVAGCQSKRDSPRADYLDQRRLYF